MIISVDCNYQTLMTDVKCRPVGLYIEQIIFARSGCVLQMDSLSMDIVASIYGIINSKIFAVFIVNNVIIVTTFHNTPYKVRHVFLGLMSCQERLTEVVIKILAIIVGRTKIIKG